jgi:5-oxoprolinase (ATP-hydrolysing) subunit A
MGTIVDLNCDIGEGFGTYRLGLDEDILPHISSVSIACGFHAGDPICMRRTVRLAEAANVSIGAHPGFPDLMGFGRREMMVTCDEARDYAIYQTGALQAFTTSKKLQHVKPHGALYNMGVRNEELARAVAQGVREIDPELILVGMAGSAWIAAGHEMGLRVAREAFADRAVNPDGTLVPRHLPGAVINDVGEVMARVLSIVTEGRVTATNGESVAVIADTICLHGDTPGAADLARTMRQSLEAAGVTIAPMGTFCR